MSKNLCYICNSSNILEYKILQCEFNHNYTLVQCVCGFIFIDPMPSINELSKYYNNLYNPHIKKNTLFKIFRHLVFFWKYKIIGNLFKNNLNNLLTLDIGSGDGFFSKQMSLKKWNSFSYDSYIKKDLKYKNINNFNDSSLDLITLWHSIEHLHNLDYVMSKIKEKIKKNGYILIACPNINSIDKTFFGSRWVAYDIPRHIYHFNPLTMKKMLLKYNLDIMKYYPMYQDTFFNVFLSINRNILVKILLFPIYIILFSIISLVTKNKASSYLYICKLKS